MIFETIIEILLAMLIAGTVFVIIYDIGEPGHKLAWILVIALLPVVGLVLYFCFGVNWRHHYFFDSRHKRYEKAFRDGTDERVNRLLFDPERTDLLPESWRPLARVAGNLSNLTVSGQPGHQGSPDAEGA